MKQTNNFTHLDIETTSKLGGKQFSKGEYVVFTPQSFTDIVQNANQECTPMSIDKIFKAANRFRQISKTIQALGLLIYPLAMMALAISGYHSTITCAGYALMGMFTAYFGTVISFFYKAHYNGKYLYRVYSLSGIIPNWTDMTVCYRALQFPYNPIESISEFSAIHGGMGQAYLFSIGLFSWCVLLVSFFTQRQFNDKFQSFGVSEICEVIGCYGLLLIGIFELDPFSKYMIICHYIGGVLGLFTIIGFNYQQFFIYSKLNSISVGDIFYRVLLPIVIDIGFVVGYSTWIIYGIKAQEYGKKWIQKTKKNDDDNNDNDNNNDDDNNNDNDDSNNEDSRVHVQDASNDADNHRKSLNTLALKNVCCESLFLILGAYSMCLYLVSYDDFLDHV